MDGSTKPPGVLDSRAMSKFTRRALLITGTAAAGGLLIGIGTGPGRRWRRAVEAAGGNGHTLINLWLKISPDNRVTVLVDKLEMGQGTHSGLATLLAEELGADWDTLQVEHVPVRPEFANGEVILTFLRGAAGIHIPTMLDGSTRWAVNSAARWFNLMFTGGSSSIMAGWTLYREAGAAARQLLLEAGAERLEADPADCVTRLSRVVHSPSGRSLSFGEVAAAAAVRRAPSRPKLKAAEQFRLIGRPVPRLDIPAKTLGRAAFGVDQRPPGVRFAALVVPPLPGVALNSFDAGAAGGVPGVITTLPVDDAVAVIADSWWSAREGAKRVTARFSLEQRTDWSSSAHQDLLSRQLDEAELDIEDSAGDVATASNGQPYIVQSEYRVPYLAHIPMEPMNCTAWMHDDRLEIWTGTQTPLMCRAAAAEAAGIDADRVTVHTTLAGGAFGRRFHNDAVVRATQIARAVNYPVQLVYSREDDMTGGYYRPAAVARVSGAVDQRGQIQAWRYRYSGSAQEVDLLPYQVGSHSLESLSFDEPIPTGPWRSVDHSQHAFFVESFVDELAAAAGQDPFEFRRRHLPTDSRRRRVLDDLQTLAGWQGRGGNGRGRGVALHESFGSVVGQVIDVSVRDGRLALDRVICVVDCGVVVNPDAVVAQMESGIVYGLSAALYGEITSTGGAIEQQNFHNQPVLQLANTPPIDVYLRPSGDFPFGVGEPGTPPSAPALASAVFGATGQRCKQLPLTQFRA